MADWDVEVTIKPMTDEQLRALRHHPNIVARITQIASDLVASVGHPGDFGVIVQNRPGTKRARAFALPINGGGIHLELSQSLLLKAAGSAGHRDFKVGQPAPDKFSAVSGLVGDAAVGPSGNVEPAK